MTAASPQITGEPPVRVELTTYALRGHFVEVGSVMDWRIERATSRKASQERAVKCNCWGTFWGTFPARPASVYPFSQGKEPRQRRHRSKRH